LNKVIPRIENPVIFHTSGKNGKNAVLKSE
jgi:hypothetical protein